MTDHPTTRARHARRRATTVLVALGVATVSVVLNPAAASAQPAGPLPFAQVGDFTRAVVDQADPTDTAQHAVVGDIAVITCVERGVEAGGGDDHALVRTFSDRPEWRVPLDALTLRVGVDPRPCTGGPLSWVFGE